MARTIDGAGRWYSSNGPAERGRPGVVRPEVGVGIPLHRMGIDGTPVRASTWRVAMARNAPDVRHFTSQPGEAFTDVLVERDEQIGRLTYFISSAASGTASENAPGTGRIAVISGPVASGKTALLHRALELTAEDGPRVLTAVTSPAEQGIPFGVVEQLLRDGQTTADRLSPALGAGPVLGTEPGAAPHTVPAEVLAAFRAQLAEIRARGPVLIVVDDVQYADPESLHCLAHAVLRAPSAGAGVSLLVTRGPDAGDRAPRVLEELLYQLRGLRVRLAPLSVDGVGRLVAARAPEAGPGGGTERPAADPALAASLHAATGGNPLLVHGLIDDRLGRRHAPAGAAGDTVRAASAAADGGTGEDRADGPPHAGERFLENALICVHRTGADGMRVAQGIALLGGTGPMPLLARLVEVDEPVVARVVAALGEAGVLDPAGFRHGGVRAAVVESLADDAAARLRRRAARLLYEDGAAPLLVATQLLGQETHVCDEEWVPRVLSDAARAALAAQRMGFAVRCLRMAESCCRDETERTLLRATLAKYVWRVQPSALPRQLRSLVGAVREGMLPPVDTLRLVRDLLWNGWMDDATTAIRQVVAVLPPSPDASVVTELRELRLALASTYPTLLEHLGDGPAQGQVPGAGGRPAAPEEGGPSAARALYGVLSGGGGEPGAAPEDFADLAEHLLTSTRLTEETHLKMRACLLTLLYADRLGTATVWTDRLLVEAADRGAPGWTAVLRGIRAHVSLRRGHLEEARLLAEQALEQLPAHGWGVGIGMPLSALIEARTAMGDHEAAAELLDRPVPDEMLLTRYGLHYLYARGRHQLATGRHHAALTDFAACGELMRRWNMDRSVLVPWRVGVAEAWLALGSREQAERFAREQLAGDAGRRVRGLALRVLAASRPARERPALLGEAVALLQEDGDWYELARALTDLGAAHKQLGDPAQGKPHTRRAWRIAEGCGARELHRSLQPGQSGSSPQSPPAPPAGPSPRSAHLLPSAPPPRAVPPPSVAPAGAARPGGPRSTAVSSLTDAERRVAALAAHGYTNREIGAKLFITVSTVEQHLTRVYRKINITHRQDLPVGLDIDVARTA
ncbi:helix-turn-helix transcriptional regulator [Streptomyces cellostaticus]|uniref:helix-turn-helix transcriptional regulator n=1 Tax=Streptomyces cellostaticus TaxID=67285 RepID=UPI0027E29A9B|nr:AAA family ATPase [Streptomyces cellostaticus]